jgi:hypothetical protein
VVANILSRWCPKINFSTGPNGSIQPSEFNIPQLMFTNPTAASDMIKEATKYDLYDWAVYDGPGVGGARIPTFFYVPRNTMGRNWQARVGPSGLAETGVNVSRIWNGVSVTFTDVTGIQRTVGPPGSGATFTDSSLLSADPMNPANKAGIKRWAMLAMGTSTPAGAIKIGAGFLVEQALLNTSGSANIVGWIQEADNGSWHPAWAIRAGDMVKFIDSNQTSYRRIVKTAYDDGSKTNNISLDAPVEGLAAILDRYSVALTPYGFS